MASVLSSLELSDTFDGWKTKINTNESALETQIGTLQTNVASDLSNLESRLSAQITEESIQMSIVLGS